MIENNDCDTIDSFENNDKTAANLAAANFDLDNRYYVNIQIAAKALVDAGFGSYVYQTTWGSGTSGWERRMPDLGRGAYHSAHKTVRIDNVDGVSVGVINM